MYVCDVHTHSIASGHASCDTISDLAKSASQKGIQLLGITDHGPATPNSCKTSYFRGLHLAPKKRFQVDLLYGVELNILNYNGKVDLDKESLSLLDYAIISMHPQNITPGSKEDHLRAYTNAMQHPKVKIIGHCDDTKYPVDYHKLLVAAKDSNVVIELNNASLAPWGYRGDTLSNNIEIITLAKYYQIPLLLSSDSHGIKHIGDFTYAKNLLDEMNFPENLILNSNPITLKDFLLN